jgi:hypothetical protein
LPGPKTSSAMTRMTISSGTPMLGIHFSGPTIAPLQVAAS